MQVEHASSLSAEAKTIKIADKIANVQDVTASPPSDWDLGRRMAYLQWSEQVVAGCRGVNAALERYYDEVLTAGRTGLESGSGPELQ